MPAPAQPNKPAILIGADPEMFVKNVKTGQFVSAHDLIPGTKTKPYPVSSGAIQVDGVAAEFNIDPSISKQDFWEKLSIVQQQLQSKLGTGYSLEYLPSVEFDKDYWETLPEVTKQLGCNPDYNAWTGTVNPTPDATTGTMRTASGHIHIGWTKNQDPNDPDFQEDCNIVVRELDYMLGIPSLLWDRDNTRRKLYGRAGACRYKPYGVEYRVLSNRWLTNKTIADFVWSSAYQCVTKMFQGGQLFSEMSNLKGMAEKYINDGLDWAENPGKLSIVQFERQTSISLQGVLKIYQENKAKEPKLAPEQATLTLKPKRRAKNYYKSPLTGALATSPTNGSAVDWQILEEFVSASANPPAFWDGINGTTSSTGN